MGLLQLLGMELMTEILVSAFNWGGSAYRTNISSILKGKSGMPGEIIGTIDYSSQNYLGEIYANTNGGILGKITENKKNFYR